VKSLNDDEVRILRCSDNQASPLGLLVFIAGRSFAATIFSICFDPRHDMGTAPESSIRLSFSDLLWLMIRYV